MHLLVIIQNNKRCTVQRIKIIKAQQTKIHNNYKNTRLKLLKTNTAIWFNKNNYKLYYQHLNLKYLRNLSRYWLQAPWWWHDSVETCRSVIVCEIIVHLLVHNPKWKNYVHFTGGTVDTTSFLDGCGKSRPRRDSIPIPSISTGPFIGCERLLFMSGSLSQKGGKPLLWNPSFLRVLIFGP